MELVLFIFGPPILFFISFVVTIIQAVRMKKQSAIAWLAVSLVLLGINFYTFYELSNMSWK